ncbi:alpha-1,2-mannosidase, partial [Reticulomyxa filosa]
SGSDKQLSDCRIEMIGWFIVCLCVLLPAYESSIDPLDYVNPYIGTGGAGYGVGTIPGGVQVPFAKVRLSPDTCFVDDIWTPWANVGGYHYADRHMRMLSHTHLFGAGVAGYGNVGVFPTTFVPDYIGDKYIYDRFPWLQEFSHKKETIKPGYYSVDLLGNNVTVELTSTMNSGVHRYTYKNNEENKLNGSFVVIDPSYSLSWGTVVNMSLQVDYSTQTISGFTHDMGGLASRIGGVVVYFAIRFNESFAPAIFGWLADNNNSDTTNDDRNKKGNSGDYKMERRKTEVKAMIMNTSLVSKVNRIDLLSQSNEQWNVESTTTCGVFVQFDSQGFTAVEMYVGISFISVEQALTNLKSEVNSSFDDISTTAVSLWRQQLSLIQIEDNVITSSFPSQFQSQDFLTTDNITVFYTALYHALCSPTTFSEVNEVYLGFDQQVHTVRSGNSAYYTDMSLWDVHRTQYPLLTLLRPDVMADISQSLVEMYKQGGDLPRWPLANGYTGCMIGQHADIVISDAIAHGLGDSFEASVAYSGMYQGATQPQPHASRNSVDDYIELGYVPYEQDNVACCDTLEYAYDDWACALVASFLNKTSDYDMFMNRSLNYRNVFDPITQFMCPRYRYMFILIFSSTLSFTNFLI